MSSTAATSTENGKADELHRQLLELAHIGLTKPSGGGGVNDELIFSNCDTNEVGSFGIQLTITIRAPDLVTRTSSLAGASCK